MDLAFKSKHRRARRAETPVEIEAVADACVEASPVEANANSVRTPDRPVIRLVGPFVSKAFVASGANSFLPRPPPDPRRVRLESR